MTLLVLEEKEQRFEEESSLGEGSSDGFDQADEVEGEAEQECVRCGRTTYLTLDEDDPLQFLCRLVREFVKSPEKALCHHCLSELYRHLGLYLQNNWNKMVKTTSSSNS